MLNKTLCAIFGIDKFNQWIMSQLDYLEDQLYSPDITPLKYIEVKAKYDALKEARDAYWAINKESLKNETAANEESAPASTTYKFEIIIFDRQDDPSRYHKLTHHFDWLCSFDEHPEVIVSGVNVDLCVCRGGFKVIVTGFITGEPAAVSKVLASADLDDWGDSSLISIRTEACKK